MWPNSGNSNIFLREVIITSILYGFWPEGKRWSRFRFNNLGQLLVMALKLYSSVAKFDKLVFYVTVLNQPSGLETMN